MEQLHELLQPCDSFPEELKQQIYSNLLTELENRIQALLETIFTGNATTLAVADDDKKRLQEDFAYLLECATQFAKEGEFDITFLW